MHNHRLFKMLEYDQFSLRARCQQPIIDMVLCHPKMRSGTDSPSPSGAPQRAVVEYRYVCRVLVSYIINMMCHRWQLYLEFRSFAGRRILNTLFFESHFAPLPTNPPPPRQDTPTIAFIMSWRNQGITGSNNIPLGKRRFAGEDESPQPDGDRDLKRGRSPEPSEYPSRLPCAQALSRLDHHVLFFLTRATSQGPRSTGRSDARNGTDGATPPRTRPLASWVCPPPSWRT